MLKSRIILLLVVMFLGGCCSDCAIEPPKRELAARVQGNSVTLVNDLEVPIALVSPAGNGTQVTLAVGAASEPLSFTVEKWKILQPGAADQIVVKDENPILQQQMMDIVLLLKAANSPRREAHLVIGPCFFDSTGPTHRTIRVSQFPMSGTRVSLCP